MNSFNRLWENSLKLLELNMAEKNDTTVFDTWIKELKPSFESDGNFYFEVATEIHKEIITRRFYEDLALSMRQAAGTIPTFSGKPINPVFMTKQELDDIKKESESYTKRITTIALNKSYTFESFVVGNSNKFAAAAANAVADSPGKSYNPLFLYGGVGLGKTHLMHAIGNQISARNANAQIIYTTCESFTNDLIEAIGKDRNQQFRNKYRKSDVLLIDDIQFISKKTSTQEEFFHTFNTLHEAGKQIIISSDKPPAEIAGLEERLLSRFQWGLLADIGMPDYETRVAILINKVPALKEQAQCSLEISDDVMHFIAQKSNTNIRDLEGALKKVIARANLMNIEKPIDVIDVKIAQRALKDFFTEPKIKLITPKLIITCVCEYFSISEEDILGKKKNREISLPRQIAMYILRQKTDYTYPKIGEVFGGRDHSTAMHADDKIKELIKKDNEIKNVVDDLIHKIVE